MRVGCAAVLLLCVCVVHVCADSMVCGQYQLMSYVSGGNPSSYCQSPTKFGGNSNGGSGYLAIYSGCHWGTCSPDKTFPRLVSDLGTLTTSFVGTTSGASHYDITYDIWFDEQANPNGRNAHFELMIWLGWQNNKPISGAWDGNGNPIPKARNVNLAGISWDYYYANPGGAGDNGPTFTFMRNGAQSGSVSFKIKDFSDWLISNNYLKSGLYCSSVQAGWEYNTDGNFDASLFEIKQGDATCGSANEGQPLSLSCPAGQVINSIDFASYGTPAGDCSTGFTHSSACHSNTSLSTVQTTCLSKPSCSLSASNDVFGDPCFGTGKRLAVKVTCGSTCAQVSEGQTLSLSCPTGQKISKVNFASYGVPQGSCTNTNLSTGSCHASTSQNITEAACVGNSNCAVQASNTVFGDPCPGTFKQLAAQVTCA